MTLENKVKELEAKVYNLTIQLEGYKYEQNFSSSNDVDLFAELDSLNSNDCNTTSKTEDNFTVESICGTQEKLMLLFSQTPVNEHSESFKYFGKMGNYMKSEILNRGNLNILEKFMFECEMDPVQIQKTFQNSHLMQLNHAMKR